ncbi:MAG: C-GCAxxG-C-C family protein [Candidatus Helarchaeota archaeon]
MTNLSEDSEIISRFNKKIEELKNTLPQKYYTQEMIDKNCAAWTILSLMEILGIDDKYFHNMASPLACISGACGAVASGLMIVGLIEGGGKKQKPMDQFKAATIGMKFVSQFKKRFGAIECRVLTDLDLTTTDGIKQYHKKKLWENKCYMHVIGAIEIIRDTFGRKIVQLEKKGKL